MARNQISQTGLLSTRGGPNVRPDEVNHSFRWQQLVSRTKKVLGAGRCCTEYECVDENVGFELYVPAALLGRLPDELHFEVRRLPRRIEACWNGCAWIV